MTILRALLIGMALFAFASAENYDNQYVNQIFLENPTQFRVLLSSSNTTWFFVKESEVGPSNFERIHLAVLDALMARRLLRVITATGTADITGLYIK